MNREKPIRTCTCDRPPRLGPKTCDECGSATTQIDGAGGFRVVCLGCEPLWSILVDHDRGCPDIASGGREASR